MELYGHINSIDKLTNDFQSINCQVLFFIEINSVLLTRLAKCDVSASTVVIM